MKTLLAALPVVALILAAPAAADITDNEFLAALDMGHVAVDSSGTSKIAVAHNICLQHREGYSDSDIIGFWRATSPAGHSSKPRRRKG